MFNGFRSYFVHELSDADERKLDQLEYLPGMPIALSPDKTNGLRIYRPCKHERTLLISNPVKEVWIHSAGFSGMVLKDQACDHLQLWVGPELRIQYLVDTSIGRGTERCLIRHDRRNYINSYIGVHHAYSCVKRLEGRGHRVSTVKKITTTVVNLDLVRICASDPLCQTLMTDDPDSQL